MGANRSWLSLAKELKEVLVADMYFGCMYAHDISVAVSGRCGEMADTIYILLHVIHGAFCFKFIEDRPML
jgi:hypothetical protein